MTSQDGQAVKLSDLRGNVVVAYVYLYAMPIAGFLSADGQEVFRAGPAARRIPAAGEQDPLDFPLVRPRARHT